MANITETPPSNAKDMKNPILHELFKPWKLEYISEIGYTCGIHRIVYAALSPTPAEKKEEGT